ncbi:hypothetical protein B0J11DRAFT_22727 [Dendryphion nanum]|uniref:Uncharacterized protein n=1 Tax=Dendryphion nanum TaxID=256645 RepID=A0A9P9IWX4_9PLEO|nr:hypothetical protein B0J11DRAFT_22727 [Dendryphion nanum]
MPTASLATYGSSHLSPLLEQAQAWQRQTYISAFLAPRCSLSTTPSKKGPNKVGLSWATFIGLSLSLLVSLLYSHFWKTEEQGFGIGQWVVAVVGAGIMAVYFHAAET